MSCSSLCVPSFNCNTTMKFFQSLFSSLVLVCRIGSREISRKLQTLLYLTTRRNCFSWFYLILAISAFHLSFVNFFVLVPNIRLSKSPNKGFIQLKNDTAWRKVKQENWDKNRQKMVCKHLGFTETSVNAIRSKEIGSNEKIATGDLACYDTASSGISCCVNLVPSTTTSKVDLPYAECELWVYTLNFEFAGIVGAFLNIECI